MNNKIYNVIQSYADSGWLYLSVFLLSWMGLSAQQKQIDSLYNLLPDTVTSDDEFQQVERVMEEFFYQTDKRLQSEELSSRTKEDFINQLHERFQTPESRSKIFNAVFWAEKNSSKNYPISLSWYVYVSREKLATEEFVSKTLYLLSVPEFNHTKQALRVRMMLLDYYNSNQLHGEALSLIPIIESENKQFNYLIDTEHLVDLYASTYYNLKMFKKAILEWKELIQLLNNDGDTYRAISLTNNIGLAHEELGQIDTALQFYQIALSKLDSLLVSKETLKENISFRNSLLSNIARINLSKGQYASSFTTFINGLGFAKKNNFSPVSYYYNLALLFHEKNEDVTSLLYLDTLFIFKEDLELKTLTKAYQLDLICAINAGKKERAIHRNLMYSSLMDSIALRNVHSQYISALIKYKTKEKESELLSAKDEKNQLRSFLMLTILASVIVVLLISQRIKNIRQKVILEELKLSAEELKNDKLKSELEKKRKEIGTKLIYLVQKNEFISSITKRLKEINKSLNESGRKELYQIINELDSMSDVKIWSEFEVRFQEIHADFYNNLTQLYPNLTPNELKLCAFLKLNLSTKEISSITYQSTESIKMARYRLRKKLNLKRDANLTAFMSNI